MKVLKRFSSKMGVFFAGIFTACLMLLPSMARAADDLGDITIDTSSAMKAAGAIIAALSGMWIVRKVIKTVNRS